MKIILIYFTIFSFWAQKVAGFQIAQIKGISLMNLSFYLLILAWGFTILNKRKLFERNNVNRYLILLILIVLFSIPVKMILNEILHINLWHEIINLKNWANPIILFFILFNIIEDKKTCDFAMVGLILLLIVTVSTMLLHTSGIMELDIIRNVQAGRSAGFAEANQYATYLVLFIPLLLSFFMFHKQLMIIRAIVGIFLILTLSGLAITGSRGGFASLLFAMSIYILILKQQEKFRKVIPLLVAVIFIGATSYMLIPSQYQKTIETRFDPRKVEGMGGYTNYRTQIWYNGLILFMERPIIGHGQNTFTQLRIKGMKDAGYASHNDYLQHLVHHGIIGLIVFIMIFYKVFRQVWDQLQSTNDAWKKKLYLSYMAGFFGYTFAMMGVNIITPRYIFWFYTAIIYKYCHLEMSQQA